MLNKLTTYLRLHYPLIWNTRVVPVLGVALILHILFFLSGFATTTPELMARHNDVAEVGGFSMYTFSVLCSIGLVIGWLVFYLRNNAYKQFYIIGKFHLAAEFAIITLVMIVSTNFFESYIAGTTTKVRTITSKKELANEVNTYNLADVFLPTVKDHYFKLNHCDTNYQSNNYEEYSSNVDYFDSTRSGYNSPGAVLMRSVISQPGAFSYRYYCRQEMWAEQESTLTRAEQVAVVKRLLDKQDRDSINAIIQGFLAMSTKYMIRQDFNPATKVDWVFEDSLNSVRHLMARNYQNPDDRRLERVEFWGLSNALSMAKDAHSGFYFQASYGRILAELYFALGFALLVFLYRLFSRRTALISLLSAIIITILLMLIGGGGGFNSIPYLYCALTILFLVIAMVLIGSSIKTSSGVLLTLHLYMLLGFFPMILLLIAERVSDLESAYNRTAVSYDAAKLAVARDYPILSWLDGHPEVILGLNLLFVFLYTAFVYTRVCVKQHMLPQE